MLYGTKPQNAAAKLMLIYQTAKHLYTFILFYFRHLQLFKSHFIINTKGNNIFPHYSICIAE